MKKVQGQSTENTFEVFGFEVLNENELMEVRGGGQPYSKDRDMFDEDEG